MQTTKNTSKPKDNQTDQARSPDLRTLLPQDKFYKKPSFLFICMGVLTMGCMLGTYVIAQRYDDPLIVIVSISLVAALTIFIGSLIIKVIEELSTANQMKTEFISIASHQLKTPLIGIKWCIELLSNKNNSKRFNDHDKEYFKTIRDANQRMINLVDDLLNISRIQTGRLQVKPRVISMIKLCQQILRVYDPLIKSKHIQFNFKFDRRLPAVKADPKKISLVIENLLSNSINYNPSEGGKIFIELYRQRNQCIFRIEDNGVGIPLKDQKHIFEKFFRSTNVDQPVSGKFSGSGLGLFIAKAIIELHQGSIWFKSQEGKGSTFFFKLPLAKK